MRRPSTTSIVAWLALFATLGGSAYAAGKIDGRSIRDRSIPARKLKADALGVNTTIRSARSGDVPPGQPGSARVLCRKGERVLGGGGSYDETFAANAAGTTPTGKEDTGDRTIGSRPIVQGLFAGGSHGVSFFSHAGWPDGARTVTGVQGWSAQSINGASDPRVFHVFAICARGAS